MLILGGSITCVPGLIIGLASVGILSFQRDAVLALLNILLVTKYQYNEVNGSLHRYFMIVFTYKCTSEIIFLLHQNLFAYFSDQLISILFLLAVLVCPNQINLYFFPLLYNNSKPFCKQLTSLFTIHS